MIHIRSAEMNDFKDIHISQQTKQWNTSNLGDVCCSWSAEYRCDCAWQQLAAGGRMLRTMLRTSHSP